MSDRLLSDSSGANKGELRDSAGDLMVVDLGTSERFQSQWYARHDHYPRALAQFYGDRTATLYCEETWDNINPGNTPTVHHQTTAVTESVTLPIGAGGAARFIASLDVRVVAPAFRFVVVNNASNAQTVARLWGRVACDE